MTTSQPNQHVYDFYNARLSDKPGYCKSVIRNFNEQCKNGPAWDSADSYYFDKEQARKCSAALAGLSSTNSHHFNPMGFWFGMQSN